MFEIAFCQQSQRANPLAGSIFGELFRIFTRKTPAFQISGQTLISYGSTQLEIRPSNKWHNKTMPADVNGDGEVSPIDALRVINFINRHGTISGLSASDVDALFAGNMLDTNNDGNITAVDALLVINHLNLQPSMSN